MCNQPLHPPCPNNSKSTATSKTGLRIMLSSWIRGRSRCTGFFQLNNWFRLISCFHDCSCLGLVDFKALRTSRDHRQVDPTQQNDLFTNRSPASKTDSPPPTIAQASSRPAIALWRLNRGSHLAEVARGGLPASAEAGEFGPSAAPVLVGLTSFDLILLDIY